VDVDGWMAGCAAGVCLRSGGGRLGSGGEAEAGYLWGLKALPFYVQVACGAESSWVTKT
jgi:hypothetical protein